MYRCFRDLGTASKFGSPLENHDSVTAEALKLGVHLDQILNFTTEPNPKRSIRSSINLVLHDIGGSILAASAMKDGSEALTKSGCELSMDMRLGQVDPQYGRRKAHRTFFLFNFLLVCAWMSSSGEAELAMDLGDSTVGHDKRTSSLYPNVEPFETGAFP
jgi:hypothetical protein